jgi:heme exporter protein A
MLLKVSNLNCMRADKLILSRVSLSVVAGDCLILRGPNGAGKTTLLRYLAGLNGDQSNDNTAFSGHLDAIKATLTVCENLEFWAGIYGRTQWRDVMDHLSLTALGDRAAGDLSAGQKRRLGLARMLLTNASVWLMDEPTVSLDATTSDIIVTAIKTHCANGGAAIISTHIDLNIPNARTLNVTDFAAKPSDHTDPFLQGEF